MRQFRLAGSRIAPARLHAAGLEIAAVGAGRNFAIGVLRGQPDFQVKCLGGTKAHVATAQQHAAVRQAQFLQHSLCAKGHALVFGVGFLGFADADQFHFLKLMLANHAAHVATTAAGFGAKAHRMRGHPQRQSLGIEDVVAHDIGQRHFAGGNQIPLVLAQLGGKQVLLELGQLPSAAH